MANKTVPEMLEELADIYRERNALYGNNYKRIGHIFAIIFPNGITLETADDFNRFINFSVIFGKNFRYAQNLIKGGHQDSLDDGAVYAMMQRELDEEAKGNAEPEYTAAEDPDIDSFTRDPVLHHFDANDGFEEAQKAIEDQLEKSRRLISKMNTVKPKSTGILYREPLPKAEK